MGEYSWVHRSPLMLSGVSISRCLSASVWDPAGFTGTVVCKHCDGHSDAILCVGRGVSCVCLFMVPPPTSLGCTAAFLFLPTSVSLGVYQGQEEQKLLVVLAPVWPMRRRSLRGAGTGPTSWAQPPCGRRLSQPPGRPLGALEGAVGTCRVASRWAVLCECPLLAGRELGWFRKGPSGALHSGP